MHTKLISLEYIADNYHTAKYYYSYRGEHLIVRGDFGILIKKWDDNGILIKQKLISKDYELCCENESAEGKNAN